jgi:hypothetical protein
MFRPRTQPDRLARGRRGAILVVVLGLLTLFAVLGIVFVFTSTAEADAARIAKERENQTALVAPDATAAVNQFLQSLIYPVGDTASDALNALRGHELLRSMYGGRGTTNVPYNGVGTFHEDMRNYGMPSYTAATPYLGRAHAINNTMMWLGTTTGDETGQPYQYVSDPEMVGHRGADAMTGAMGPFQPTARATVAKNAPYTYPDLKDLYLASVSPLTGEVLVPSFHRNWLFNAANPNPHFRLAPWNPDDPVDPNPATNSTVSSNTSANTDWVTPEGRLKILRPRPIDQLTPREIVGAIGSARSTLTQPVPPRLAGLGPVELRNLYNLIRDRIADGTILGYPQQNQDQSFTGDHTNMPGGMYPERLGPVPPGPGQRPVPQPLHKADSLILDTNMPLVLLSNGKYAKPVVSATITDMNGRLNPSVHGNLQYQPPPQMGGSLPPRQHMSHHGIGPWEVNMEYVLGQAGARAVVYDRSGPPVAAGLPPVYNTRAPAGASGRQYERTPYRLTAYAPINWQVNDRTTKPSLPGEFGVSLLHTSPTFVFPPFEDNTTSPNHPSIFNPAEWGEGTKNVSGLKTYSATNLRRMTMQFAPPSIDYEYLTFPVASGLAPVLPGTGYRLVASHTALGQLTPRSTSLDRPGLMPNFMVVDRDNALRLVGTTSPGEIASLMVHPDYPVNMGVQYPGTSPNTTFTPATTSDFGTSEWRNIRAALGPVDINRRLADYRDLTAAPNVTLAGMPAMLVPTPQPFSANNMANAVAAATDRHNLAKDIFNRLVAVTGAWSSADAATNPAEYNALRYLAQLAANIVDYIDNDDVSTVFVWNPTSATDPTPFLTPANLPQTGVAEYQNRVVYGFEKPRLVLNEIYSEITNNAGDGPPAMGTPPLSHELQVRFWVELLNPTTAPYSDANGPFGTGGVDLLDGSVMPYQIAVRRVTGAADTTMSYLADPANVKGDFPPAVPQPDSFVVQPGMLAQVAAAPAAHRVQPNGSAGANQYAPQGNPASGMVIIGPPTGVPGFATVFNPQPANPPWDRLVRSNAANDPADKMLYTITGSQAAASVTEADLHGDKYKRHVVMLRRLANPYLPQHPDTNPFITVDMVDHVPAHDGVGRLGGAMSRVAGAGATDGYEPLGNRFAVGKMQPYMSYARATAQGGAAPQMVPNVTQFNNRALSAVLQQTPTVPTPEEVRHTFGRHNGQNVIAPLAATFTAAVPPVLSDTIATPYDWLVHMDRPLVNSLELLHMQGIKPHLVTQYTFVGQPFGNYTKALGQVPFLPTTLTTARNGLYRAFDVLRVQDRTYGVPHGGKVNGRVNINTVMHPDVFRGLFDAQPQTNSAFTDAAVYDISVLPANEGMRNDLWSRMIATLNPPAGVHSRRTVQLVPRKTANETDIYVPLAGPTVHDIDPTNPPPNIPALYDRPYLSFGVANFEAPTGNVFAAPLGSGVQDTILRNDGTGTPAIYVPGATHDYFRQEAARKVMNNLTTTSETFAATFTIAFHEIRMRADGSHEVDAFGRNLLGKEIYKEIPGDLRQQFFTVIDRANVATDNTGLNVQHPFFTTMEAPPTQTTVGMVPVSVISIAGVDTSGTGAGPFVVYSDGFPVQLNPNATQLVIGVGGNSEGPYTFTGVTTTATPGVLQVTLSSLLSNPHAIGTCVSNARVGPRSMGGTGVATPAPFPPLTAPTGSNTTYSGIIPYYTRVR